MAKIRGAGQSLTGFSDKIRDIVAEKGTAAAAKQFGRSSSTINSWAKGTSAPNRYDDVIGKVNRSVAAYKPIIQKQPELHREKLEKKYGSPDKSRTGSILDYMKVLKSNGLNLSRNAQAFFIGQHEQGNVVSWTGNMAMPVSNVRIIPAMSNPAAPVTGGAQAFGLTSSYFTGEKGKKQERVRGIVTQTINRAVYKTKKGGPHKTPDKMTLDELHAATKDIHLSSKVNAQRLPSVYLGFGED